MNNIRIPEILEKHKNFSLSVPELNITAGEKIAIIGANGAGKSTFLKKLAGKLDSCHLSQTPFFVENLSVYLNVYSGNLNKHSSWQNLKNIFFQNKNEKLKIKEILTLFHMEEKLSQIAGSLSGGEKMKLVLARAVYGEQKILLADEPLSAIADTDQRSILEIIFKSFETSFTIIHHKEYLQLFDKVLILDQGKMKYFGPSSSAQVKNWSE